jgi:hypothetical protein
MVNKASHREEPIMQAQSSYHRALQHFAAKLLVQAENQPKPVRDHLRLVAAELQLDAATR